MPNSSIILAHLNSGHCSSTVELRLLRFLEARNVRFSETPILGLWRLATIKILRSPMLSDEVIQQTPSLLSHVRLRGDGLRLRHQDVPQELDEKDNYNRKGFGHKEKTLKLMNREHTSFMEDIQGNSNGVRVSKRSRSLDLKTQYKSTIPKDSVDKSLKRKHRSGIDGDRLKHDKRKQESL